MSISVEVNIQESWTQTLITIYAIPEDDPVLREIRDTTIISANINELIDIHNQDFIYELPLIRKEIIDLSELEELEPVRDAQNQTFLQGVPVVIIPIEYKDEALQTMYMSSPCPPMKYEKITASINRPMPVMKYDRSNQTSISIVPTISQYEAVEILSDITYEKRQSAKKYEKSSQKLVDEKTIIREILNFIISRALWISDPVLDKTEIETKCQETQTVIRYDAKTGNIRLDNETQTYLTCEPRYSNSKLLAEYEETKKFVQSCLQKCFMGIESRIIIDDLLDEIIVMGAHICKCPMEDQVIQTVTSCRCDEDTEDEDVLRKLRILVVVDPFEAPIVIAPLIDELLRLTCNQVSRDAWCVVPDILNSSVQRAVLIGFKLADIQQQSQSKSIEQIFDQRRKKIMESMKAQKETTATQTGLAGISEIAKFKESGEILCQACTTQSIYHWCLASKEDDLSEEDAKILHTQDILLAYNPCYVAVTTSEEATKNSLPKPTNLTKKMEKPTIAQLLISQCTTSEETRDISNKNVNVLMTPKKNIQTRDSITEWTHIIDSTLAKSWSPKGSASNATNNITTTNSTSRIISKSCCESCHSESFLSLQATKALQTLKSTFCTRDTCPTTFLATLRQYQLPSKRNEKRMTCNLKNCKLLKSVQYRKRPY